MLRNKLTLSWDKLSKARTELSEIKLLLDLLTIKLMEQSHLVKNQSQFMSMMSCWPKVTLNCYYHGQNKLSWVGFVGWWVGGWLAGESHNKANLKPAELN